MAADPLEPRLVDIDKVFVHDRLRRLRPDKVDELAQSIAANGLLQPIVVHYVKRGVWRLIAGAHRLAAVPKLGHNASTPPR